MINLNEKIARGRTGGESLDLVCLSHLRWDFVCQRPQHLLRRAAREGRRVFFVEEPIFGETPSRMDVSTREDNVTIAQPHLPHNLSAEESENEQRRLLDSLIARKNISDYILWYYTPMALGFSAHLHPRVTVYDCMDELAAFKYAPRELRVREAELLRRADLIFTGGQSIYDAKLTQLADASRLYCYPSSIDFKHFAQARTNIEDPADQASLARPRLGFFGVVDERFDIELLRDLAAARPAWQFVIIGPVVKIDPATLPRAANIHYLGGKSYSELPAYLAGWDVALLLFAHNEATRFISPTKTPEYLAAAKPVISTSVRDVVRQYGERGLVKIADTATDLIAAAEELMSDEFERAKWLGEVDNYLAGTSWDKTWNRMSSLIRAAAVQPRTLVAKSVVSVEDGARSQSRAVSMAASAGTR